MKQGRFIVFEGIDKSGKTTLSKLLYNEFLDLDLPVQFFQFPNRNTEIGHLLDKYLKDPDYQLDPRVLHLLFSANRWEMANQINDLIKKGINVICDRYYYSGVAYSLARGDIFSEEWIRHTDEGLPEPSHVYFLDISPQCANLRKGYGSEVYEEVVFQTEVRDKYLKLYSRLPNWKHIDVLSHTTTAGNILVKVMKDLHL